MNDLHDYDVEILADVLGIWDILRLEDWRKHSPFSVTRHDFDDGFRVHIGEAEYRVDARTTALMLLGHLSRLRVDIGECPACHGAGVETQRAPSGKQPDGRGWSIVGSSVLKWSRIWQRPCPACTVDSEPTGREILDWASALMQAMPREVNPDPNAADWGNVGQALARADVSLTNAGDARTREAIAVLADQLQREPDPPCPDCEGVARQVIDNAPPCRSCSVGRCPVCGDVLRAGEPCSITMHGMTKPPEWTRSTGKDHRAGEQRRTLGVLISAWLDGPDVLAKHPELGALVRDVADEIINAGRPPVGPIARIVDGE